MRTALLLLLASGFLPGPVPVSVPVSGPDWSQWRGPKHDGLSPDTGLLKQWPAGGPPLLWTGKGLGSGFSSVSVLGDRIYTMGDSNEDCRLLALSAEDGHLLWETRVGAPVGHKQYPGPRGTPATDGKIVVALGQLGDLVCVDAVDGKEKWRRSFEKDFGGRMMSGWRYSESPLLEGELVLCTPGGSKGTVVALRASSGETVWQSAELTDPAAYASLVPAEIGGVKQVVVFTGASVAGLAIADGKLLWKAERPGKTAVIPTPIVQGDLIFVTSGYGIGCNAFRIVSADGKFKAEEVYAGKQMKNHHGGVLLIGEHVYGLDEGTLKCLELKTGKTVWEDRSVGKGSIAYADGNLVVRSEATSNSALALVEATPAGYREKGRFVQPDASGKHAWAHPVIIGGRLYLRDQDVLLCYDLKAK